MLSPSSGPVSAVLAAVPLRFACMSLLFVSVRLRLEAVYPALHFFKRF